MKIKYLFLAVLLLATASINFAQAKAKPATSAPDAVVKNFYATHDAGKSPFFQTKNRALVDRYFMKEMADLIWKDALCQVKSGGICNLDFNVPYATNGGDRRDATQFQIGKPEYGEGNSQLADVPVSFKLFAAQDKNAPTITILYRLEQDKNKVWKISDVYFPGNEEPGDSLKKILSMDATAEQNTEADQGEGELQTGKTESVILYVGAETGDYAAYCFMNDSEAGRAILARCKNGGQCRFSGKVDFEAACKVPGLEADLSSKGRIVKIETVKSLGRRKQSK